MATITATNVKKPGPPVPPRPHAGLLKSAVTTVSSPSLANRPITSSSSTITNNVNNCNSGSSVRMRQLSVSSTTPDQLVSNTSALPPPPPPVADGRTVIYKSPTTNAQKKQENREKRFSGSDFTAMSAAPRVTCKPSPAPLPSSSSSASGKQRKASDAPLPPQATKIMKQQQQRAKGQQQQKESSKEGIHNYNLTNAIVSSAHDDDRNNNNNNNHNNNNNQSAIVSPVTASKLIANFTRKIINGGGGGGGSGGTEIFIIQNGELNRQNSLDSSTTSNATTKQLYYNKTKGTLANPPSGNVGIFRRSKTTLDNLTRTTMSTISVASAGDANVTTSHHQTGGFLAGKSFELKNNLKNAAERLFSEIMVNQQPTASTETPIIITKHEKAHQHQMIFKKVEQEVQPQIQPKGNQWHEKVMTSNCTRICVNQDECRSQETNKLVQGGSSFRPSKLSEPQKKIAFHEILISELAAMRGRSSSAEQLHFDSSLHSTDPNVSDENNKNINNNNNKRSKDDENNYQEDFHHLRNISERRNSLDDGDADEDNCDDEEQDEDNNINSNETMNSNTTKPSLRKRCPSGCSSDSSPYGTERTRIRTSDWIEVGDNGKEVTLTSCHISLEDSGLEDEERLDDLSSGVGDSWDSVKDDENERFRMKRIMSATDLPPLPKSLSDFKKVLAARRNGHLVDSNIVNNNNNFSDFLEKNNNNNNKNLECQKDDEREKNKSTTDTNEVASNPNTGCTLDTQLAILRKEMFGLRQLDLSLLSQLWALNDSIQEFRTILQEQESFSPRTPSPSPFDSNSVSSDGEEDLVMSSEIQSKSSTQSQIITTQPKSIMSSNKENHNATTTTTLEETQTPPLPMVITKPKHLSVPLPRMRSAPPPPPIKKMAPPPRPM